MIRLLSFTILTCYLFCFYHCANLSTIQQNEQTLITSLLGGYNKNIRPDYQVSVDITATLQQILAIDEKQQIMTSSSFISQTWFDDRFEWTPSALNSNIEVVMLPVKSIWIPDTMILNSADTSGYLTISDYSMASVYYSGQVYMILPALTIKTRCDLYVRKFPFDTQMCSINLTSWSQGYNRIAYTENKSLVIDISGYSEHPVWKLNGTDMVVIQSADRAPFEDTYNHVISVQLYLIRKPLYFMMNGIFACLVLNCVTLLSYALVFATQVSLCMICFMTFSVYSLSFSNLFPQQSEYLMMITLYFLLSIAWTAISLAWFVVCNHYTTKGEMPKFLFVFCGKLQRMFFCCFPPPAKADDKKDKNKDVIVENGGSRKDASQGDTQAASTQKTKCICCQKLFASCRGKPSKVETANKNQEDTVGNMEVNQGHRIRLEPIETARNITINETNPPGVKPFETAPDVSTNEPNSTDVRPLETAPFISTKETNEKVKEKCNFCNRCESCQADLDKTKAKDKAKKEVESKCAALNYLVFIFVFLFMFITELALWIIMGS